MFRLFLVTEGCPGFISGKQQRDVWDYLGCRRCRLNLFFHDFDVASKLGLIHVQNIFNIGVSGRVWIRLDEPLLRLLRAVDFKKGVENYGTLFLAIQIWVGCESSACLTVVALLYNYHSIKLHRSRPYAIGMDTWLWSFIVLPIKHVFGLITWRCRLLWSLLKRCIADEIVCLCSLIFCSPQQIPVWVCTAQHTQSQDFLFHFWLLKLLNRT